MESQKNKLPSLPPSWFGFLLAGLFLIFEFYELSESNYEVTNYSSSAYSNNFGFTNIIAISAWIYWLFCVHRFHKILFIHSNGKHDIKPGFAVLGHFIPFFNLYWIFHWPNEISEYVNSKSPKSEMPKGIIGITILIGLLLGRFFDGAIGMSVLFGIVAYLNKKFDRTLLIDEPKKTANEKQNYEHLDEIVCPVCGSLNPSNSKYCIECGNPIFENDFERSC